MRFRYVPRRAKRFHVAVRPQIRRKRRTEALAALAVAALGLMAYLVIAHFPREQFVMPDLIYRLPTPSLVRVDSVRVTGVSDERVREILADIGETPAQGWTVIDLFKRTRRVQQNIAWLRSLRFRWAFWRKEVRLEAVAQKMVALVLRNGRKFGWIAESGALVKDLRIENDPLLPTVELHALADDDYLPLVDLISALRKDGALRSPVSRLEFVSPEEQWRADLADGTRLLWGNLNWTDQKIKRLQQVLSDAAQKFGGGTVIDLRYFEFGKILAGPPQAAAGKGRVQGAIKQTRPLPAGTAR